MMLISFWHAALGSAAGGCRRAAEEGIEDIPEAAHVEALEAPAEQPLGAAVAVAVVGGALLYIREHLVGFVHLLEPVPRLLVVVMVGVMLEGQLAKSLSYLLVGGVTGDA